MINFTYIYNSDVLGVSLDILKEILSSKKAEKLFLQKMEIYRNRIAYLKFWKYFND